MEDGDERVVFTGDTLFIGGDQRLSNAYAELLLTHLQAVEGSLKALRQR